MTPAENYSSWKLLRDIFRLIRPYRGRFWTGMFFRVTSDIVWLYPAYALSELINFFTAYSPGENLDRPLFLIGWWVFFSFYHFITHDIAKFFVYQVGERAALDASIETIRHLFLLDLSWHERENTGNKLKRIQKGGEGVNKIIRMVIDNVIEICVNFFGMLPIIFILDHFVALSMGIFLILYYALSFLLTKKAAEASHHVNVQEEHFQGFTFEALNNIQTVTVLRMKGALTRILGKITKDLMQKIRERIFRFRMRNMMLHLCGQIFRLLVLGIGVWGVWAGYHEVGFLALVYGYFDKIWESVEELSEITNEFIIAKYGIHRMVDILKEPIRIESEQGKKDFPKRWEKLSVENLSFAYDQNQVLKNLSFEIKKGEKIGIVGLSGGGKSTLFKLFLKQREEYSGEIRIDDVPLRSIKKSSYLTHVAVVLQDTELFNMSLRENILIASPTRDVDENSFQKALKIAHVEDFLGKLPHGVNTLIGEKGIKLSGGEKQRLGIARAVFRKPQILFLDEATSHLDIESERKIQDSLHRFFKGITAIVIAHRLSTIKEMDRILVIEKGRIIESGSFRTLMKKKGRFHELWEKQQFL